MTGDALVSRARSRAASYWFLRTDDDVFLMIDDDIVFEPDAPERVVALARERDIVAGVYPMRDGSGLGHRIGGMTISQDESLVEVLHAGAGFLAVHRRVLEGLRDALPLCYEGAPSAYWPFFMPMLIQSRGVEATLPKGVWEYLSEDWAFCERARAAGFKIWLDESVHVGHLTSLEVNVDNMGDIASGSMGDSASGSAWAVSSAGD
jgi:hypothetical protein